MPELLRGALISLEGIDGSGKSTLAEKLKEYFLTHDITAILTKEPGGTAMGQELRTILQSQKGHITSQAEFLLFAADRAQHMKELIQPALQNNKLVISDRMADSAVAYQGYGRGLAIDMIKEINTWAMNGFKPDITLYLKIDLETSMGRINKRNETLTSFEQEKKDFFERTIFGFNELYKNRTDVIVLDGKKSQETVIQEAIEKVTAWLKHNMILS